MDLKTSHLDILKKDVHEGTEGNDGLGKPSVEKQILDVNDPIGVPCLAASGRGRACAGPYTG